MPTIDLTSPEVALWSALAVGFLFGFLPIGLAEVSALAIGSVGSPRLAFAMLGVFTAGHVGGKLIWYFAGRSAERVRHARTRALIAQARTLIAEHRGYGAGVLALSALSSVPPFHLAAIAAGIARIPFLHFLVICLAGRWVRFALVAAAPAFLRSLLG